VRSFSQAARPPILSEVSDSSRSTAAFDSLDRDDDRRSTAPRPRPDGAHLAARLIAPLARRWRLACLTATAAVALLLLRADLARTGRAFVHARPAWLGVALGLMVVSLVLRSYALKVIVDAYGAGRARLVDVLSATSIGLLSNAVAPVRVGTVLGPYTLFVLQRRRRAAVPFTTVLGMALTERLFAIASFVALSLLFVSTLATPAWAVDVLVACAVFAATFLTGGVLLERRRRLVHARDGNDTPAGVAQDGVHSRRQRLAAQWPALVDSQRIMGRPWSAALVAATQAGAWIVQLAAAWAALQAFHLGGAGLRGAGLVLVLTNLIGLVPATPGNLGTFQAATVAALAVSAVAAGPAVAYGLGLQALQLVVAAVAGLVSLSLQDLSLADLRLHSGQAASRLAGERPGAARAGT